MPKSFCGSDLSFPSRAISPICDTSTRSHFPRRHLSQLPPATSRLSGCQDGASPNPPPPSRLLTSDPSMYTLYAPCYKIGASEVVGEVSGQGGKPPTVTFAPALIMWRPIPISGCVCVFLTLPP